MIVRLDGSYRRDFFAYFDCDEALWKIHLRVIRSYVIHVCSDDGYFHFVCQPASRCIYRRLAARLFLLRMAIITYFTFSSLYDNEIHDARLLACDAVAQRRLLLSFARAPFFRVRDAAGRLYSLAVYSYTAYHRPQVTAA